MEGMKFLDAPVDFLETDRIGVPHGASAIRREAVTGEINGVDVGGAQRMAFFKDARAFVDHDVDRALEDFVGSDGAARMPLSRAAFSTSASNSGSGAGLRFPS